MEACGSAHYWARKLIALGHTVKLMAPQFVKPYLKSNKSYCTFGGVQIWLVSSSGLGRGNLAGSGINPNCSLE
jgi:hypothetical protein